MTNRQGSTIYDVAKTAEVSISTVSRCLNSPSKVNPETLERVQAVIHQLGYIPHGNTGPKRHRHVGRIGVFSSYFIPAPSMTQRLQGAAQVLHSSHTEMIVYTVDSPDQLEEYLNSVPFTKRVDGLILISLRITEPTAKRLAESGLPVVTVEYDTPFFPSITADNFRGGELAGSHFVSRGYAPCAYLGQSEVPLYSLHPNDERQRGYESALASGGTGLDPGYIRLGEFDYQRSRELAGELFDLPVPPRALFAMSDLQAYGAIKAARERGMRIPEDVAIIGFDDLESAEYMELSTVSQGLSESGRLAAESLNARIADPHRAVGNISLDVSLVHRGTT